MKIQLALDRLTIPEAIRLTRLVESDIDWIEVGTSLIKEFGMESVREIKKAFPHKTILADTKTMDNAKYEGEISFTAGADIITVMGNAPKVTIETCLEMARIHQKRVMIDLLNTSSEQLKSLLTMKDAIFCLHISKDEQELSGKNEWKNNEIPATDRAPSHTIAAAGGITIDSLPKLLAGGIDIAIIGSAITKAANPSEAAKQFKQLAKGGVIINE
ncbi:MAG: 3-hexulose-6-phosphate synthase [Niallia sp.]|nr:3-hexulose-6-phosphate synthase [Mycobacteroides abscessus subsp. abscessus]HEO8422266.1 orotidine 5'-phosphate decarboxylase [Yersinia enterocolitica]